MKKLLILLLFVNIVNVNGMEQYMKMLSDMLSIKQKLFEQKEKEEPKKIIHQVKIIKQNDIKERKEKPEQNYIILTPEEINKNIEQMQKNKEK